MSVAELCTESTITTIRKASGSPLVKRKFTFTQPGISPAKRFTEICRQNTTTQLLTVKTCNDQVFSGVKFGDIVTS
jgi:hypothetical protein